MKKINILSAIIIGIIFFNVSASSAEEQVIKIEVPASVEKVDIKYENKSTYANEKTAVNKTLENTKKAAKKTAKETKKITRKTVEATKSAAQKTADGTKSITNKTVENTKNIIEDINASKEVTAADLEKKASIKTLKNEQKALKAAYNSRIKDTKAKIKATEQSTVISDVQKRNKIYTYEKQILDLEQQRDSAMKKYDAKINYIKNKK